MRQKKSNAQNPVRPAKKTSRPAAKRSSPFEKFYREKDKKKDEESFTENRKNSRAKSPTSFKAEDKPKRSYTKDETKSYGSRDEKPKRSFVKDETKSYGSRDEKPKRSYGRDETKSYGSRDEKPKRSYGRDETKSYGSRDEKPKRSYGRDETKSYGSRDDKPKRSYGSNETKSYGGRDEKPKRSYGSNETKSYGSRDDKPKRSYGSNETKSSYGNRDDKPKRSYGRDETKSSYGNRDDKPRRSDSAEKGRTAGSDFKKKDDFFDVGSSRNKTHNFDDKPRRSYERDETQSHGSRDDKPTRSYDRDESSSYGRKDERTGGYSKYDNNRSSSRSSNSYGSDRSSYRGSNDARYDRSSRVAHNRSTNNEYEDFKRQFFGKNADDYKPRDKKSKKEELDSTGVLWLNKFLAQAGICSRRKAAELIKDGTITVNGVKETNPAYEVKPEDLITYLGKPIQIEEKKIYLIMNKPKNVITTVEDEKGRKTVLDLIKEDYAQRLFPVGRLDRQTTGLLLLTNDGELTKKLTHPSHQIKKVYSAVLDKNLALKDLEKIKDGVELEDGKAEVDSVDYITAGKKNEIGIELHSGKNRIVRRIFESLGYEVEKLDRTLFAGLTKKDLPRGFYRELNEKEVIMLKHFTNMRKG